MFQVGWLLIILGSQSNLYLLILPLLVVYLLLERRWHQTNFKQHIARITLAVSGFVFDSILEYLDLIHFSSAHNFTGPGLAPLWLFLMWLWFAVTFSTCYRWMNDRPGLAITFGFIFGPIAYWGASRLTDVQIINPIAFTLASAIFWGVLFAVVFIVHNFRRQLVIVQEKQTYLTE